VGEGVRGAWDDILYCGVLFGTGNLHFHFSAEALVGGGMWYCDCDGTKPIVATKYPCCMEHMLQTLKLVS
jgi:hypothetical protein